MQRGRAWRVVFVRPAGANGSIIALDEPVGIIANLTGRGYSGVGVNEVPLAVGYGDLAALIDRDPLIEAKDKARQVLTPFERELLGLNF